MWELTKDPASLLMERKRSISKRAHAGIVKHLLCMNGQSEN